MENTNYPLQEKIQSFVNGDLEEAAHRDLLEQSGTTPGIAEEIAFSQSLAQVLRHRELVAASAILSGVIAEEGFPPPASSAWGKWGGWATGLFLFALLCTLAYWGAHTFGLFPSKAQLLSRSAVQPLENVLFLPANGDGFSDLQTGMVAYDAGRYKAAATLLTRYEARRPDQATRVYLGVSRLLSGQADQAIRPLSDAAQSPEPPIQEAACWYLALAYLEQNDLQAARQMLARLPVEGNFGGAAQDLLRQLPVE